MKSIPVPTIQEKMAMFWEFVQSIIGTNLMTVAIPLLMYWIYKGRKVKNNLRSKVVLITGASSGLGEALAHVFYKSGSKLILCARRIDELERVKSDLMNLNVVSETFEPIVFPIDLSEVESVPGRALEALSIYDEINILINNAGVSHRGSILDTNLDVQKSVMTINYFGQIALTNAKLLTFAALLPSLIRNKGHVVAISSIQGRLAIPYRSAYAASKHALQAYMDCLRSEIPNIKVTVVNPGYIKTNMSVNAVTGTGEKYGVSDAATEKGYSPEYVAEKILRAVIMQKQELTVATLIPKLAILLRVLTPSLLFYMLKKLAKKNS